MPSQIFGEIPEGTTIQLYVSPNAPRSEIVGEYNHRLKVKIHAPPVDGKANEAIIRLFSQILKIPQNRIEILKGDTSKNKTILVRSLSLKEVQDKVLYRQNQLR